MELVGQQLSGAGSSKRHAIIGVFLRWDGAEVYDQTCGSCSCGCGPVKHADVMVVEDARKMQGKYILLNLLESLTFFKPSLKLLDSRPSINGSFSPLG